jgi:hypothetical protein
MKELEGTRLRPFPGTGDRHYFSDLKRGGRRILSLVDASASRLDETIRDVIRRRKLGPQSKRAASKWLRCMVTSEFQVNVFKEPAKPLIDGTPGRRLDAGDEDLWQKTGDRMRRFEPAKGTSPPKALEAVKQLKPVPDGIFLLVDGLPTMAAGKPWRKRASGEKRLKLFKEAIERLPGSVPVNVHRSNTFNPQIAL